MKCKICGFEGKSLVSHLKKHNITPNEYKIKYNVERVHTVSEEQKKYLSDLWSERMKEEQWKKKYDKNRKSIWTENYWIEKGMGESDAKEKVKQIQSENAKKRDYKKSPSVLTIDYYISKGYTETEAKENISEIQSKLSSHSKRFTGKRHTTETRKKISKNMSKHISDIGVDEWLSHFGDMSDIQYRSNAEIELYEFVDNITNGQVTANTFLENYNVDIVYKNKIIEYFGVYWHCHPDVYPDDYLHPHKQKVASEIRKDDNRKIKKLKKMGYDIMIVWENEYMKNKIETENKIKKFIYDS